MNIEFVGDPLAILDFDVECRPLHWYGGDFVSKQITAIAWQFIGTQKRGTQKRGTQKRPRAVALGEKDLGHMLEEFVRAYDAADAVTGHFIRGFDLPLINGACLELGLPPLGKKLTQDTKLDLMRFSGLSKSQENLGALLGLKHPKVQMDQAKWREANKLTPEGIALTKKRVTGDVAQHIEMREELLNRGMLNPVMKLWTPTTSGKGGYHA
jgi:hypothetical protein